MAAEIVNRNSKLIQLLNAQGYYFIYPDCRFAPLNVAQAQKQNGPAKVLGPLSDFINSTQALPQIISDQPCPDMVINEDNNRDVSFGLNTSNMTLKALQCLLKADISMSDTLVNSMDITFNQPTMDLVYEYSLIKYLGNATVSDPDIATRICGQSGNCFAITETLKSNQITIKFKKDEKAVGKTDIEPLLNSLTVKSEGTFVANDDGSVTYTDEKKRPLPFAFKGVNFHIEEHIFRQPSFDVDHTGINGRKGFQNKHEGRTEEIKYKPVVDTGYKFARDKFF